MIRNKCTFIGRLGQDPKVNETKASRVANFSIAVDAYKREDPPTWINCEIWDKGVDRLEKLRVGKGDLVAVEAEFRLDTYTDKKTEEEVERPKFRVYDFEPLKLKAWDKGAAAAEPEAETEAEPEPEPAKAPAKGKDKGKGKGKAAPAPEPEDEEEESIPF